MNEIPYFDDVSDDQLVEKDPEASKADMMVKVSVLKEKDRIENLGCGLSEEDLIE